MEYINPQSRFLKKSYTVEPFSDYVKRRIASITQEMTSPPYAVEGEEARTKALNEFVKKDPYGYYEKINTMADSLLTDRQCQPVTRLSDPVFYDVMGDCCAALGFKNTVGYVYTPKAFENPYNAMATGYLDMTWVMVSKSFLEGNLLTDLELAALIGHELGHTAARHSSFACMGADIKGDENRRQEYTADRAGLMAALWRAERLYPDLDAKGLADKALEASVDLQRKLELLFATHPKGGYNAQTLRRKMEETPVKEAHAKRNDSHPTCWERKTQLEDYVKRIEFLECIHTMWGSDHRAARRL